MSDIEKGTGRKDDRMPRGVVQLNRGDMEVDIMPREMVQRVLGDIKEDYKRRRGKTKARLDSLRLSTASMLAAQADSFPVLSEQNKSAIRATEQALLGNWEPMGGFIDIEVAGVMLGGVLFGSGSSVSSFLPALRKLRQSLGEVKNE